MRARAFANVLDTVRWCAEHRAPFTVHDLAAGIGVHKRTAYRYLVGLEGAGVIEPVETGRGGIAGTWISRLRITRAQP